VNETKNAHTYKAEAFDILQYLYGTAHDPIIHCLIRLGAPVDASLLIKAVTLSLDAVPMIRCAFDGNARRPRWRDRGYTGGDIVHVRDAEDDNGALANKLMAGKIDILNEPQLKIYLIKGREAKDTLCVLINHMICDAAGFKQYLYLLAELYTKLTEDADAQPDLKYYPRNAGQLFKGMSLNQRLRIKFSKYDTSAQKKQDGIHLEGDVLNPFFVTRHLDGVEILSIKSTAKAHGATFYDMVLAAYAKALRRKSGAGHIVLPCPVDLRKYIINDTPPGICNLTSNYIVDLHIKKDDPFQVTLKDVATQMKRQKESDSCLKSVFLWQTVCRILPFQVIKQNFKKFFTIPLVSFSNLGVLDENRLRFGETEADDVFMTGAVKYVPYFQIAVSTFKGTSTLSCNLHGTENDRRWIESFLKDLTDELKSLNK
jgi:NRPS condensation-like uncharacterized protein